MPKRAFIIHGWGGFPEEGWFPWLKRELEAKGFTVTVPAMPDAAHPLKSGWMPMLEEVIGEPDAETYLIGHSLGCQAILLYLQSLPIDVVIGGVVLVAPVAGEESITDRIHDVDGAHEVLDPWITTSMDWAMIGSHARAFVGVFSDDDRWIRSDFAPVLERKLGARTMLLHHKSHFSGDDGINELPEVLNAIIAVESKKE